MRGVAPIAVLIFIGLFFFLASNYFEWPRFLWGETQETIGIIVDLQPERFGKHYLQKVTLTYQIDDSIYTGIVKAGRVEGKKVPGDTIRVVFEVENPSDFRISW